MLTRSTTSYVYHVTESAGAHARFHKAAAGLSAELSTLEELPAGDPHEHSVIAQCEALITEGDASYKETRLQIKEGNRLLAAKF